MLLCDSQLFTQYFTHIIKLNKKLVTKMITKSGFTHIKYIWVKYWGEEGGVREEGEGDTGLIHSLISPIIFSLISTSFGSPN